MRRKLPAALTLLLLSLLPAAAQTPEFCQDPPRINTVHGLIRAKYGSTNRPDLRFLRSEAIPAEVTAWVNDLRRRRLIADPLPVDLGADNSFIFKVKRGEPAWRVRVSKVGPYVVMFRLGGRDTPSELVDCDNIRPDEHVLLRELGVRRFKLLNAATLDFRSDMKKLRYPQEEYTMPINVWQALFSEDRTRQ